MKLPTAVSLAIVGRDREQAELAAALAGARAGHGGAVLLLGETWTPPTSCWPSPGSCLAMTRG